jgi:hypothetical protein
MIIFFEISLMPSSRYRIVCSTINTAGMMRTSADPLYVDTVCCNVLYAKLSSSFLKMSPISYPNFVEILFSSQTLFEIALSVNIIDFEGIAVSGINFNYKFYSILF